MTQNYAYFKDDSGDDIPSGKIRGEVSVEIEFQRQNILSNRACELKTIIDPRTKQQVTKIVELNSKGKVVTTRLVSFIDHPTLDARAYLINDNTSNCNCHLDNSTFRSVSNKTVSNFEEKTKEELETLGFKFGGEE